jgi:hypothetical protein
MPHQIAVTVRAPLRPGRGPEVAAGVAALRYPADLPAEQPDAAPDEESR